MNPREPDMMLAVKVFSLRLAFWLAGSCSGRRGQVERMVPMGFHGGNFDLWGEQASGSSWEIQVWWCCTRWRWTKASWFERKKGGKTIWSKFEPVRICNRCNLLRIRRCLHCLEPCLQEVFGRVGTKRNLSGFSYQATRNMATFIPCAYPLHWMLMLNTDTGCICILGAYNAVYHSYHASDW